MLILIGFLDVRNPTLSGLKVILNFVYLLVQLYLIIVLMKHTFILAIALLIAVNTTAKIAQDLARNIPQQPAKLSFTENKGQIHDQNNISRPDVLFGVMAGNMAVHIKNNGVSYQLYKINSYKEIEDPRTTKKHSEIDNQTIYRIDLTWLNSNPGVKAEHDVTLPGYCNYYLESCREGALNVKSYAGVTLKNLYKGIDVHYYEKNGDLKHDYIVAPHADYKQIKLKVDGAQVSISKDGSLLLTTLLGQVYEGAPLVFQNGKQLVTRWRLSNNVLGFEIENYDPDYELLIDPVTRVWGTYYGGLADDRAYSTATDANGDVYFSGYANPTTGTILATSGSYQSSINGSGDAFLAKFSSNGTRIWATYFGGSGGENAISCAVDLQGNVIIGGYTGSSTGMSTPGSHQPTSYGGSEAFVAKFSSNGTLLWGTFYCGYGNDSGYFCDFDASGNVYLVGTTAGSSGTEIATNGSHQQNYGGGSNDAFLVKFNASGVRQWGTFYGGTASDGCSACTIDASGNIYITGASGTSLGTVIATAASHQPAYGSGGNDAYLAKFNTNGLRLWATYYGGTGNEYGQSCATDVSGNVYFSGFTNSSSGTSIATGSSYQPASGGLNDAFLVKLDANGVRQWGTYYGGTGTEFSRSIVVDGSGNIYMTGHTDSNSGTAMASAGSYQPVYGGGTSDGFVAKFNNSGLRQWGTYYGGTGDDFAYCGNLDPSGSLYICGYTDSNTGTAIATNGSYQQTNGGQNDPFLVKFDVCEAAPFQPGAISGPVSICSGVAASYSTATSLGAISYTWTLPVGWSGSANSNVISATPGTSGVITVIAGNACGASPQQTFNVAVNTTPIVSVNSGSICAGQSFTLVASGANTYNYSGGPVVSPAATTSYSVSGSSSAGCPSSNTAVATVIVRPLPTLTITSSNPILCVGESATITATGASSYTFSPGGAVTSTVVTPLTNVVYNVMASSAEGCTITAAFTQNVEACTGVNEVGSTGNVFILYPNPASGILNIEMDSENEIEIVNVAGQVVYSGRLNSGKHQVETRNLPGGIYLVKIAGGTGTKQQRIVIE